MNLTEDAYNMPTGMLLHEAGRQFAMAEIVRDGWQQTLFHRGGWFLLLVWAERTCRVPEAPRADRKPTKRERLAAMAMLQAYLQFHARKFSRKDRELSTWMLLFAWAWHGGKPSDPIPGGSHAR